MTTLKRDHEYLVTMKEMDENIKKKRIAEKDEEETKEGEGGEGGTKKGLEMTHVVPVAGLVMARFHIYECECLTALDLWDPAKKFQKVGEKKFNTVHQKRLKKMSILEAQGERGEAGEGGARQGVDLLGFILKKDGEDEEGEREREGEGEEEGEGEGKGEGEGVGKWEEGKTAKMGVLDFILSGEKKPKSPSLTASSSSSSPSSYHSSSSSPPPPIPPLPSVSTPSPPFVPGSRLSSSPLPGTPIPPPLSPTSSTSPQLSPLSLIVNNNHNNVNNHQINDQFGSSGEDFSLGGNSSSPVSPSVSPPVSSPKGKGIIIYFYYYCHFCCFCSFSEFSNRYFI